jgi:large subunit ribosomal protein L13
MKKTPLRQNVTNADRTWFVVDASEQVLGKLATKIADTLRGKRRVDFTPHVDGGDYVVVLNADKIKVLGKKEEDKTYHRHSRYFGNLKTETVKEVREKNPTRILQGAVSGMLTRTRLRDAQLKRLFLIAGDKNPHEAQQCKPLDLK